MKKAVLTLNAILIISGIATTGLIAQSATQYQSVAVMWNCSKGNRNLF